ncbi:MAG: transposase family protein, partial [Desulfobulbaceae bacterium]|nr:transposase family protein [Desulfobulbaceae bacterium]
STLSCRLIAADQPDQTPNWMSGNTKEKMHKEQAQDPDIAFILMAKEGDGPCPEKEVMDTKSLASKKYGKEWDRLEVQDGVLYRRWFDANTSKLQLIVPYCFRHRLLKGLHDNVCAGHFGWTRTQARVSAKYYWYGYQQDVEDWCRRCEKCQRRRTPKKPGRTRMKSSKVGHRNQKVALDLLGPLPVSNQGNKWILLIADYFSKWPVAVPLPNAEARTVAQAFIDYYVSIFGIPEQLHSDQGRQFESHLFAEMCLILGISKSRTSPYWAQSDGLVERMNSVVEAMISKYVSANQKDWDEKLQMLMLAYRSSIHSTTGYSPNMMIFGTEPNLPIDLILGHAGHRPEREDPLQLRETLNEIHNLAREHVHFAQQVQERGYNQKINVHTYKPDEKVWLRETQRYKG